MNAQNNQSGKKEREPLQIWELVVFAMLGAIMFCSKIIMEVLPNVHMLGMFTMVYTIVFRKKALIPIYIYVLLNGLYAGFNIWWIPYLYIWSILWGITMLLPQNMPPKIACVVYPVICGLHGFFFGVLYAPGQAVLFGFDLRQTFAWIISGLPWDAIHGVGNFCTGLLVLPLGELLRKLLKKNVSSR